MQGVVDGVLAVASILLIAAAIVGIIAVLVLDWKIRKH